MPLVNIDLTDSEVPDVAVVFNCSIILHSGNSQH